jgi:hypothetical protein
MQENGWKLVGALPCGIEERRKTIIFQKYWGVSIKPLPTPFITLYIRPQELFAHSGIKIT